VAKTHPLIYDWNVVNQPPAAGRGVMLDDETLRDGLQSPSVRTPSIDQKIRILHLINDLGIDTADIGLPGAGPHVVKDVERLAREIVDGKLAVRANCASRTLASDIQPIVDIAHNELFVCLGSNPAISQMSILEMPNALGRLREVVERGGRVISVDPRRTETARRVGEHWFIRPGTDAYLLLAVLHVLVVELGVSRAAVQRHAVGLEALCAAAQGWPPERAARVTGIGAGRIRELARAYQRANGACLYVSTGVTPSSAEACV